jgi:inactivated superfamily I helicase
VAVSTPRIFDPQPTPKLSHLGISMTISIFNKTTNSILGTINEADLQFLNAQLEEESSRDTDYFIDQATVDILEDEGGSAALITMLRGAVGTSEGIDISWNNK